MSARVFELRLPTGWHVLDLDPVSGPLGRAGLVRELAASAAHLREPVAAAAAREAYDRLADGQRARGVLVSALRTPSAPGGPAAALEVVPVTLPTDGHAPAVAADGTAVVLGRGGTAARVVERVDLPAGPAVLVADRLLLADGSGTAAGCAQVWLPQARGAALLLTLTEPGDGPVDVLARLLFAVAGSLSPAGGGGDDDEDPATGRAPRRPWGHGPIDRHSRARRAAT